MKKQMRVIAMLLALLMWVNILPISAVADSDPTEPESISGTSQTETDGQPEQTETAEEPESSDAAEEPDPTDLMLPEFASKDGAGLQSANPPPSGSIGASFFAATDMVGGTFSDSAGIVDSGDTGYR